MCRQAYSVLALYGTTALQTVATAVGVGVAVAVAVAAAVAIALGVGVAVALAVVQAASNSLIRLPTTRGYDPEVTLTTVPASRPSASMTGQQ